MVLSSGDYAQSLNRFVSLASEAGDLGTVPRISGATRDDGTFSLPDVPPGAYTLIAEVRSPTTIAEIGSVAVTVDGSNLDGITVTTAKAGTLRGTIVADAGVTRRLPPKFDVYARPRLPATDNTFASAEAGAFELVAPPGPFTIEAAVPDGWMVKSITIGGVDASEFAIDIGREQNMPVTVVLTDRVTTMTGTVTGDQAGGAYVVVFPAESGNWTSRRIRRARTDTRGRFRISGLPAGDRYLAVAVDRLDEGDEEDPDFLRKVQDYATSFDLRPDEAPNVTVKVFER
jgi:hypothetical protein